MPSYRLNEIHCPTCSTLLNGARGFGNQNERMPQCGDLTICVYCAAMLQFIRAEAGLGVRVLSPKDLRKIAREDMHALQILVEAQCVAKSGIRMRQKEQSRWN